MLKKNEGKTHLENVALAKEESKLVQIGTTIQKKSDAIKFIWMNISLQYQMLYIQWCLHTNWLISIWNNLHYNFPTSTTIINNNLPKQEI